MRRLQPWFIGTLSQVFALAAIAQEEQQLVPPPSPELLQAHERPYAKDGIHPNVVLRDKNSAPIAEVGGLVSYSKTCGSCHDTEYIESHGYHFQVGFDELTTRGKAPSGRHWDFGAGLYGRWDPLRYGESWLEGDPRDPTVIARFITEQRARLAGGGPASHGANTRDYEPNCALCHVRGASLAQELVLPYGAYQTAALESTGLVALARAADGAIQVNWNRSAFQPNNSVKLAIETPRSNACGSCHGLVTKEQFSLKDLGLKQASTETTGQIFSPTRMSDSLLNLSHRDRLNRSFDVHAERLLECKDCHFAPNNPAAAFRNAAPLPAALIREPRTQSLGEFLRRPNHNFAKGESTQGHVANSQDGTMRRCENCHNATSVHHFLPKKERHLERIACESCHVNMLHVPARRVTDYTVPSANGEPRIEYRGFADSASATSTSSSGGAPTSRPVRPDHAPLAERDPAAALTDYRPALLQRRMPDGTQKLFPYNLVTSFFWVVDTEAGPRPINRAQLQAALYGTPGRKLELLNQLDRDRDGKLTDAERVLLTKEEVQFVTQKLIAAGAVNPRIFGEIQPFGIHHGIAEGRFALRDCNDCHRKGGRIDGSFDLAEEAPFGSPPKVMTDGNVAATFDVVQTENGGLVLHPNVGAMKLHVFGQSRIHWLDTLGLWGLGLVVAGTLSHGAIRAFMSMRKRRRP